MRHGIQDQAERMVGASSYVADPEINDSVKVNVPKVDRPRKFIAPSFIGVIIGIKKYQGHKLYSVGTRYGCIRPLLSRNQFKLCRQRDITQLEVVNRERVVSIRDVANWEARKLDRSDRPSTTFCRCATDLCNSRRCMCRRQSLRCTGLCQHGREPRSGRINQLIAAAFRCKNM